MTEAELDAWVARMEVAAVGVLPWPQQSPVAAHIDAEGIRHV